MDRWGEGSLCNIDHICPRAHTASEGGCHHHKHEATSLSPDPHWRSGWQCSTVEMAGRVHARPVCCTARFSFSTSGCAAALLPPSNGLKRTFRFSSGPNNRCKRQWSAA